MSYEPTVWKTGDVVTSAKLNKLEQGVADAGGAFVVSVNKTGDWGWEPDAGIEIDKTYNEIYAAVQSGQSVMLHAIQEPDATSHLYHIMPLQEISQNNGHYIAGFSDGRDGYYFVAESAEGTMGYSVD